MAKFIAWNFLILDSTLSRHPVFRLGILVLETSLDCIQATKLLASIGYTILPIHPPQQHKPHLSIQKTTYYVR